METPAEYWERQAAALCQLASGQEVVHDAPTLTALGPGRLFINVLSGAGRHNYHWIPPLLITGMIRARFREALEASAIPLEAISAVELLIGLELKEQQGSRDRSTTWMVASDRFIVCSMDVSATVISEQGTFTAKAKVRREWPVSLAGPVQNR